MVPLFAIWRKQTVTVVQLVKGTSASGYAFIITPEKKLECTTIDQLTNVKPMQALTWEELMDDIKGDSEDESGKGN